MPCRHLHRATIGGDNQPIPAVAAINPATHPPLPDDGQNWQRHTGQSSPLDAETPVWVLFRDGEIAFFREASWLGDCWFHDTAWPQDDIIAFAATTQEPTT